jgi:signal transduction histidine kinase
LGEILLDQRQMAKAYERTKQASQIISATNNQRLLPRVNLLLGILAFETNQQSTAVAYLHKVIEEAMKTGNLLQQRDAHFYLSKIYSKQNNQSRAIEHSNQYLILNESIRNVDLTREIERLQFQLEIEKKEKENEILLARQTANEALINQQKLQNTLLVIILVFISVLAGVHWWNSKKRKEINVKLGQQNEEIKSQREEIMRQNQKLSSRNQQLSELNHEKDTLMSIVAHDLKAPLNRIKGLTDIIRMESNGTPSDQIMYLKLIEDSTRAGLDLIKDLLDVNMLEENVQPKLSSFDISTFLLEKMESFKQSAETKNIHLQITRVESEKIYSDIDYLGRIVDNLISNAIKFSKHNTNINLSGGKSERGFWICIQDEGPGFSERDKEQLFQKFKKLSAQPTAGETSNGLGLAIVKTLVDRLGGEITLRSEKGKGSDFLIHFVEKQPVSKL